MSKVSKLAAGLAVVPMLAFSAPAFADSPGVFGTSPDEYLVKNVTKSGSYATTATATCNDELKYSIRLHNSDFGKISNITVKATLPSTSPSKSDMTASGTNAANATTTTSGSVTVTLGSNQSLGYETGTTQLFDGSSNLIKTLPDGITTSGVNVGDLNGSTFEFVQFKAKVSCTTTPPETPKTPEQPKTLVNTGAGDIAGLFAGVAVLGALAHRLFTSRRLSRQ